MDFENPTGALLSMNFVFETALWILGTSVMLSGHALLSAWETNAPRKPSLLLAGSVLVYDLAAAWAIIGMFVSAVDDITWGFWVLALGRTVTAVWLGLCVWSLRGVLKDRFLANHRTGSCGVSGPGAIPR
jgi:hypothetical protein